MTGDVVTVPAPCVDCGARTRRLTPAGDLICTCRPSTPTRKETT